MPLNVGVIILVTWSLQSTFRRSKKGLIELKEGETVLVKLFQFEFPYNI